MFSLSPTDYLLFINLIPRPQLAATGLRI